MGRLLVTSKHIKSGRVDLSSAYRISDADFQEINKRSQVDQWDVIFTMIGTVGESALVVDEAPSFTIKNVGLFKNRDELSGRWLYYFLRTPEARAELERRKRGSTQQYISLGDLRSFPLWVPLESETTKSIVSILQSLDDRINLLRQINTTLEVIAQALFKSWFVDFDPVYAKAEGREPEAMDAATAALFPSEFEESELGPIPKSWHAGNLRNLAKLRGGKQLSRESFTEDGQFPIFGGAGVMGRTNVFNAEGAVVTVGRVGAYCGQFFWHDGPAWVNNNASHIIPHPEYVASTSWVFLALKNSDIDRIKKGAAQPFVSNFDIEGLPLVIPDRSCIDAFIRVADPIFYKASQGIEHAQRLTDLRDTLLPRLISGKLRLPELFGLIEEAIA